MPWVEPKMSRHNSPSTAVATRERMLYGWYVFAHHPDDISLLRSIAVILGDVMSAFRPFISVVRRKTSKREYKSSARLLGPPEGDSSCSMESGETHHIYVPLQTDDILSSRKRNYEPFDGRTALAEQIPGLGGTTKLN